MDRRRKEQGRRSPGFGFALIGSLLAALALALTIVAEAPGSAGSAPTPAWTAASGPFRQGAVLVGFHSGVSAGQRHWIERAAGAYAARRLGPSIRPAGRGRLRSQEFLAPFELQVPDGEVLAAVGRLRHSAAVAYAEPDYLMRGTATPNDTFFGLEWWASNTGQAIPTQESEEVLGEPLAGTPGADDGALKAWSVTTGSRSIVIGEVDTGVDLTHPDLAANIWSNPGGVFGCPAGTHGYNVLAKSCLPEDEDETFGGHGTHVAGIMGAVGDNGEGVAGMNWQTTILPVKWMQNASMGETSALIEALQYEVKAKQEGVNVRVVNDSDSFFGTAKSEALENEIEVLGANNMLFVASAGNTGNDNDEVAVQRYPCSYDRANEICATSTNNKDELPSWANYGPHTVDLGAPGVSIYSTFREGRYGYLTGGSMAAAQVSGAAALILSAEPSLSATQLKADILENVDKLPSLEGKVITGGRLDVCKALPGCESPPPPPPSVPVDKTRPVITGTAQVGDTVSASTGTWTENLNRYTYQWERCGRSGARCVAIARANTSTYRPRLSDLGWTLRVSVTAFDSLGPSRPAVSNPSTPVLLCLSRPLHLCI